MGVGILLLILDKFWVRRKKEREREIKMIRHNESIDGAKSCNIRTTHRHH